FTEHVATLKHELLEDYEHQDYPFSWLTEALRAQSGGGGSPLISVAFNLDRPVVVGGMPGIEASWSPQPISYTAFDLYLNVTQVDGGLVVDLDGNTDLFTASTLRRFLAQYVQVLESVCADPAQRASDISLLNEAERQLVLSEWNPEERSFPEETCVHRLFATQAERTPGATALEWSGGSLSYGELHHRSLVLAREIERLGVESEDRVATYVPRSPELIVSILGILEAGAIYVPIDPKWPAMRRSLIADDAEISLAIFPSDADVEEIPAGASSLGLDRVDFEQPTPSRSGGPASDLQAAYINYTSGSTGKPKGVLATHRSIVRLLFDTNYVDLDQQSSVLQMSNASFDGATFEIWAPLLRGGCCVLYPDEIPDPQLIGRMIRDSGVNTLFITTALFNRVVSEDPLLFTGVRWLSTGGEVMSAEHMARAMEALPETHFANIYGPTENTVFSSWFPLDEAPSPEESVPIGFPITHTQAYVLDSSGHPVPPGVVGELYLGGDGLARGYFKRPGKTAEVFVPNPFSQEPGARLYRTGDLVSHTPSGPHRGSLRFHGRVDHQVKIRGFRIELGEIENRLTAHGHVTEAIVLVHGEGNEKMLVAYVVIDPDAAPLGAADLRSYLGEALPDYMVPQAIQLLPRLPLSTTGKVDRKALPTPDTFDRAETYEPPRDPLEERLAEIWKQVLAKDRMEAPEAVGVHSSFFELGGHSLSATQVISRIRDRFEVSLTVRELFDAPTIAELAEKLRSEGVPSLLDGEDRASAGSPLRASGESSTRPAPQSADQPVVPSFSQERLWILDRLDPGAHTYNMPFGYRIQGSVDAGTLQAAMSALVDRHDALRTLFLTVDGQVQPTILPTIPWTLERHDLRQSADAEAELDTLRLHEAKQGFDLAAGPLFRTVLVDLPGQEHVFLFTVHHIVFDGWSMRCFLEELQVLYAALEAGETPELPALPIQYQDFAAEQREAFDGGKLDAQMDYWRERLAGVEGGELPSDHPRPPVQTHGGAVHHLTLDQDLTRSLKSLAENQGVSLFITLLAAFKVLVHRRTQADEVVIGAPIAGRNAAEVEPLIGFFLNTLVLRTHFSDPD
ncbi:MAG: amino acid adenylation domain-containing protein, partial [Acidobacteriota bacterium]